MEPLTGPGGHGLGRRAVMLALATAGLPLRAANEAAGGDAPRESLEYAVKGAYLFKFGEFVDWPEQAFTGPTSPFVIAVIGSDAMADVLEALGKHRLVKGRPVQVKRVQRTEFVTPAQMLFVGGGEIEHLHALAESLKPASVLTVTESSTPTLPSGMINFVIRDNRVRFEIDADAADQAGLKISSKVLSLAVAVKPQRQR